LLARLPAADVLTNLSIAIQVLARVLDESHPPIGLAELAGEIIGDAYGLHVGVPAALVLRALAFALGAAPAASAAERRPFGSAPTSVPTRSLARSSPGRSAGTAGPP